MQLNFKKPQRPLGLVSGEKAKKFLWKGAVGYMAYLVNQPKDKVQVERVPIIKEYPDVFPKELGTLPPEREIEFVVDLLPKAAPISKIPY